MSHDGGANIVNGIPGMAREMQRTGVHTEHAGRLKGDQFITERHQAAVTPKTMKFTSRELSDDAVYVGSVPLTFFQA